MLSKNITVFAIINAILLTAVLLGVFSNEPVKNDGSKADNPAAGKKSDVPYIGKIQVLNGCGTPGVANDVTDFLRANFFDVKNARNALTSNYASTLVISRTRDMTIAKQVAAALKTDRLVLCRNEDTTYDVTVIIGHDYKERLK